VSPSFVAMSSSGAWPGDIVSQMHLHGGSNLCLDVDGESGTAKGDLARALHLVIYVTRIYLVAVPWATSSKRPRAMCSYPVAFELWNLYLTKAVDRKLGMPHRKTARPLRASSGGLPA
jgi:hypothetical protein